MVFDHADGTWLRLRRALERYLIQNPLLLDEVSAAWQDGYTAESAKGRILTATKDWLASPRKGLAYDPLSGVSPDRFRSRLKDPLLQTAFAEPALSDNREGFLHKVWELRAALQKSGARDPLDSGGEAQLQAFLRANTEPKALSVPDLNAVATGLRTDVADPSRWADWKKQISKLPDSQDLRALPGFMTSVDGPELLKVVDALRDIATDLTLLEAAEEAKSKLLASSAYGDFKTQLRVFVESSGISEFAAQADYADRLPFWITGDLGVVLGFFAPSREASSETGAGLYFGVNFYLVELDKSEPLGITQWSGHDWGRRFALAAGLTLTELSGVNGHGLDGVIGSSMLMTGAGLRLTDYLRVTAGALFYAQKKQTPLSDDETIRVAPYVSASLDIDVVGTISGWFDQAKKAAP